MTALPVPVSEGVHVHVLASGSKGNASIIEYGNRCVLVDCGICKRDFFDRCNQVGVNPAAIEAVLVTHEHTDHTKGLGVVLRGMAQQGVHPALFVSDAVLAAGGKIGEATQICDRRDLRAGQALSLAGMQVYPFHTSHDAAESFGFRFEGAHDALGFMTDTGVVTGQAHDALQDVRILAIESNHDVAMLHNGDYPYSLKVRVEGEFGHLSNDQCAAEVQSLLSPALEQIVAMHISENNNTFGMPVRILQDLLHREGHTAQVQAGKPRTVLSAE